jgi:hypothetical protein
MPRRDRASRVMAAPPERVWAALVDIVPGERVVQAVDFVSDDPAYAGTMTIVAEDVPDGISTEDHAAGLASSLANLAAYVEQ